MSLLTIYSSIDYMEWRRTPTLWTLVWNPELVNARRWILTMFYVWNGINGDDTQYISDWNSILSWFSSHCHLYILIFCCIYVIITFYILDAWKALDRCLARCECKPTRMFTRLQGVGCRRLKSSRKKTGDYLLKKWLVISVVMNLASLESLNTGWDSILYF